MMINKKLSIDFSYIDECNSYVIALVQNEPVVKINKSAFDKISKEFTKKRNGKTFLACPQNNKGLKNVLPVLFVYKRYISKRGVTFMS